MIPFVPAIVPNIVQALVFVLALVLCSASAMRRYPIAFYVLFIAASALTFARAALDVLALGTFVQLLASCYTGVAFYLLVMFAGALPKTWEFTKRLLSVRSEMSIIGGFVIGAHVLKVLALVPLSFSAYWPFIWGAAAPVMFAAVSVVGVPLLVCFLLPWITSFRFVRRRMGYRSWKRVQRLAYPFMALLIMQGILLAVGHGLYVGLSSAESTRYLVIAMTYALIGVAYLALKLVWRAEGAPSTRSVSGTGG